MAADGVMPTAAIAGKQSNRKPPTRIQLVGGSLTTRKIRYERTPEGVMR